MSDEQKPDPLDVLTEPTHRERMAELRWVAEYGLEGPRTLARGALDLIRSLCSRVQKAEAFIANHGVCVDRLNAANQRLSRELQAAKERIEALEQCFADEEAANDDLGDRLRSVLAELAERKKGE